MRFSSHGAVTAALLLLLLAQSVTALPPTSAESQSGGPAVTADKPAAAEVPAAPLPPAKPAADGRVEAAPPSNAAVVNAVSPETSKTEPAVSKLPAPVPPASTSGATEAPTDTAKKVLPTDVADPMKPAAPHASSGALATMAHVMASLSRGGSENVVLSPYGFEIAGDLLLAGADGNTRAEWLHALGYPKDADGTKVASVASKRREALKKDVSATLSIAAAAWSSARAPLKAEYIERIRRDHGSHAATVDFGNPAALATINGWFRDQTQGRVPALIDRLSADTQAVLGSALFFQGKWQMPFDPAATRDDPFQSVDGEIQVPTMRHRFAGISYCAMKEVQAVRLPFIGGNYEMTVVLPATPKALPPRELAKWLKPECYTQQTVEFSMPRLSLEGDASLVDALRAAGLTTALGPQSDYKSMSDIGFTPDRILQKTVLKIDEAGAEAAAATAIIGTRSAAIQKPAITMIVDRPYYVILRHVPSDVVLALALVRKPK